ncbi:MAG: kdpD [Moraxellaceae bacterium]|nr:kdpD [Moraxellaceae bacterium]
MNTHSFLRALKNYLIAVPVIFLAVLVAQLKQPYLDRTGVFMVYMLGVVLVAFLLGRGPAFLAGLLSVLLFLNIHYDTSYRPQNFEIRAVGYAYLFALAVMLFTAGIIGSLAGRLRQKAVESEEREARTAVLYVFSDELAGSQTEDDVLASTRRHVAAAFQGDVEIRPAAGPGSVADIALPGGRLQVTLPLTIEGETRFDLLLDAPAARISAREQREFLASMAKQCTQALERIALRRRIQQKKVQIQKESLRNSILSTLSHDLRTPLASIIGASSSLLHRDAGFSPEAEQRLRAVIHDEAHHMLHLVENLLDMARLQGGDLLIASEWEALEEMVGSAVAELRRRTSSHEIIVQVPRDLPFVRCDSVLIERVIINLLENAVKYSPAGGRVWLAARTFADCIEVTVSDEGEGIPEELREKVFEPFVRLHAGVAGGGIGLTICRSIVEAHGGHIRLAAAAEGGLSASFTLPVSAEPPSLAREAAVTTDED